MNLDGIGRMIAFLTRNRGANVAAAMHYRAQLGQNNVFDDYHLLTRKDRQAGYNYCIALKETFKIVSRNVYLGRSKMTHRPVNGQNKNPQASKKRGGFC